MTMVAASGLTDGSASPDVGPFRLQVQPIAALSMVELLARLTPARGRSIIDIVEWLSGGGYRANPQAIIGELCERLVVAGLPLDRYGSATSMVTAEHDAVGRFWLRGQTVTETKFVGQEEQNPSYLASPFYVAAETGTWVELWLPDTPDEAFGIVKSLRDLGIQHYICAPILLTNGANAWVTFATCQHAGFSEQDLMMIALLLPALSVRIDARVGWSMLDALLRTYVGDEPHKAILAGRAKRGQVTTIRAAMLVADLRDSTGHTANLSAVGAVDLFNDLFDCLVPPIETREGEVLKYLGDGLLAIFRETKDKSCNAADRALAAAEAAFVAVEAFNVRHPERRPLRIGVALHYGEVAYGNVGSGLRLDFTVIGRDVALASRIAGMNGRLKQPLLLSASFARYLKSPVVRIGLFPARGFAEQVEMFRPSLAGEMVERPVARGDG